LVAASAIASTIASRTVLKYKPDKVWKFVKQGECHVDSWHTSKSFLVVCEWMWVTFLKAPFLAVCDRFMIPDTLLRVLTMKFFSSRGWKVWNQQADGRPQVEKVLQGQARTPTAFLARLMVSKSQVCSRTQFEVRHRVRPTSTFLMGHNSIQVSSMPTYRRSQRCFITRMVSTNHPCVCSRHLRLPLRNL
jgi:hypothetical protein